MNTFQDKNFYYTFSNKKEFTLIYNEIFKEEIYNLHLDKPKLIVDIGGHIGLATMYFKRQFSQAKIITYEPNPYAFELLKENIQMNKIEDVEVHQTAITSTFGERNFYIDSTDQWYSNSSLSEQGWDGSIKDQKKITVSTTAFSSILELKPDLIKLDIEGNEQALIKRNLDKLSNAKNLIIEFHDTKTQDLKRMLKLLRKAGFTCRVEPDSADGKLFMIYAKQAPLPAQAG